MSAGTRLQVPEVRRHLAVHVRVARHLGHGALVVAGELPRKNVVGRLLQREEREHLSLHKECMGSLRGRRIHSGIRRKSTSVLHGYGKYLATLQH